VLYQLSYSRSLRLYRIGVLVAREGFEPPKALHHLIYSQSPLTSWVPRHAAKQYNN
jgi:hypothetical protein